MTEALTDLTAYEAQLRKRYRFSSYRASDWRDMAKMVEEAIECNRAEGDPSGRIPTQTVMLRVYRDMEARRLRLNVPELPEDDAPRPRGKGGDNSGHGKPVKKAAEGAIEFLRDLITEKGLTLADVKLTEDHLNPEHFRYLTARDCYEITEDVKTRRGPELMMTDGQRDLLAKIMVESSGVPERVANQAWANMQSKVTKGKAKELIELAIKSKKSAPKRVEEAEEGFYEIDGDVVKVQRGVTSGNLFAKRLVIDPELEKGFEWVYVRGLVAKVKGAQRLTRERAAQIGQELKLYGWCFKCGQRLTDEESMERGIGRICWEKM